MKRRCYVCKDWINVDPDSAMAQFKERFETEAILEAVVICNECDDEIQDLDATS